MIRDLSPRFLTLSFALLLLCTGLLSGINAAQAEVARLVKIQPLVLSNNRIQVRFDFTLPPPLPQSFQVEDPARLVLDFWGVENDTAQKVFPVRAGPLQGVELGQGYGRLRATINTSDVMPWRLSGSGNSLFLEMSPQLASMPVAGRLPLRHVAGETPLAAATRLQGMEFEQDGVMGRVFLTLSDDRAGVDILEEGNNVLVNLLGAQLSEKLQQRLNVQKFGTPLLFMDAFSSDGNTAVLLKPGAEPYHFSGWQLGRNLIFEFLPQPELTQARFSGRPMTVNLQQVSVRAVLQMIAETAGQNLVVSDTVEGQISLRLLNVPWRQALNLVMHDQQLSERQLGAVSLILSRADIEGMIAADSAAATPVVDGRMQLADGQMGAIGDEKKAKKPVISTRTEMMPVRHHRASDLRAQLIDAELLSPQGNMEADDTTGMLVVNDTDEARARIRDVLGKLDVIIYRSLLLETHLVAAPRKIARDLGVRWSDEVPHSKGLDIGFRQGTSPLGPYLNRLQAQGQVRILSRTVKRLNSGDEVSLERARELTPLIGRRTDHYQDVVLSLDAMTRIQQGGRILMDIDINRDILTQADRSIDMSIANNEAISSVVVPDGDSLVLTGFLEQVRNEAAIVPARKSTLGKLPRNTENSGQDMELLVFITPVLEGSSSRY
ncbi:MAG: AMIN domain-containing protein [Marinobacterium sp.]|nr:AMIN domain-containing protein [Marinobacterium sp.]